MKLRQKRMKKHVELCRRDKPQQSGWKMSPKKLSTSSTAAATASYASASFRKSKLIIDFIIVEKILDKHPERMPKPKISPPKNLVKTRMIPDKQAPDVKKLRRQRFIENRRERRQQQVDNWRTRFDTSIDSKKKLDGRATDSLEWAWCNNHSWCNHSTRNCKSTNDLPLGECYYLKYQLVNYLKIRN